MTFRMFRLQHPTIPSRRVAFRLAKSDGLQISFLGWAVASMKWSKYFGSRINQVEKKFDSRFDDVSDRLGLLMERSSRNIVASKYGWY